MKNKAIAYLNALIKPSTTKSDLDLIEYCKKCVCAFEGQKKGANENFGFIDQLYEKFYSAYCRKGSKEQGRKTWRKKLIKQKGITEITEKARKIVKAYNVSREQWESEGREKQYIPLISSWLNANIPD